jgi:hypothetical protein
MATSPSTGKIQIGSLRIKTQIFLAYRGMRQKRYESVEKMLDLLDVCKRIGPKFPLDAMFLDPHDRKSVILINRLYSRVG